MHKHDLILAHIRLPEQHRTLRRNHIRYQHQDKAGEQGPAKG
jgi:hypothetical protein